MLKKLLITIAAILLIVGTLGGIKGLQIAALIASGANASMPAEPVTTAVVTQDYWEPTLKAVGSLTAVQGVTVAAETPGKVVAINFEPGATVNAGDLLLQQDTSIEEAMLRSAEASMALAKINLNRAQELIGKASISQSEVDTADAQFKQAAAQADNVRAAIAKKTIRAPFAGRLGIRLVNLGQTLREGEGIVSLQTLDPIFINFTLPQQELARLAIGLTVRVTSDAAPGQALEGKITAINPEVDASTRNVRVQATLANPSFVLRPGMFASAAVVLPTKDTVLAIPATAVLYAPYGDSVFVVEPAKEGGGKVVRQQFVRLGVARGDYVAIKSGLKAGETVVTTGVFKLRNGTAVTVDNTLSPDFKLDPKPTDS
jgi:membrane fusion protein (multidrug efflux system)